MTTTESPSILLPLTLTLALLATGCRGGEPGGPPEADATGAAEAPAAEEPVEGVAFEPAYPTDVSAEGLRAEDVAQQETGHPHGGDDHSHGDGEHSHGEDEAHDDHRH